MDHRLAILPAHGTIAPAQLHTFGPDDWRPANHPPAHADTYNGQAQRPPASPQGRPGVSSAPPSPRMSEPMTPMEQGSAFEELFYGLHPELAEAEELFTKPAAKSATPEPPPQAAVAARNRSKKRTAEELAAIVARRKWFCNRPQHRNGLPFADIAHTCDQGYVRQADLKRHLREKGPNGKPFGCETPGCIQRFSRTDARKRHERTGTHTYSA